MLFAETGVLMVIRFGAIEERRVTWLEAVRYAFKRVLKLVYIVWFAVVRLLLIALPFLVAVGVLYWLLLQKYDINYYLTEKPPEFQAATVIAGVLLTVMAVVFIIKIAGWLLALPMVLFEATRGKKALRASISSVSR